MTLFSRIGQPFYYYRIEKQEWLKDEKIDDFTLPCNVFDNVLGLFRRFNLWQSSNGVCRTGIVHKPRMRSKNSLYNISPILTGDQIQDADKRLDVTYSENFYKKEAHCWLCKVEFGKMPAPLIPEEEHTPTLLKNLSLSDSIITEMMLQILEDLPKILAACPVTTPNGLGSINAAPALPMIQSLIQAKRTLINLQLYQTQESLWH